MSDSFASALDYVHSAVAQMQARGLPLTASRESLAQLAALAGSITPAVETPVRTVAKTRVEAPPEEVRQPAERTAPRMTLNSPVTAKAAPAAAPLPPRVRTGNPAADLEAMRPTVLTCTRCPNLVASRTNVVFGVGNPEADLMFVGEAPGEDEDKAGEPFVGKAGQLLTKIIETMGFTRDQVFIANVLKCRPDMPTGSTGNRKPTSTEMRTCLPYLEEQIGIIQPRVLVALGATAMEGLLGMTDPMARLRGRWHDFKGTPLMATYHPAYLLRNQALSEKRKVWEDMLLVMEKLGCPISEKQRAFFLPKS
ncbi:MAG: uracil-DNA glycosylase [Chthoniobacteraceae bacterium]